jgi:serine/threonine-protein kinase HipA
MKIPNSDFELLKAIGGECAGALSILPSDYQPDENVGYKKLTNEDLTKLLLRKGNIMGFTSEGNRPRLSLAGAQDKCPIFYDGKDFFLPIDAMPSTHIIKFEMSDYRHIPAYEYCLTQLAKTVRLPVVECQLKWHEKNCFLLVKRYDRVITPVFKIQRLHQEDFCQALGIGYEHKYQQDGGPSFYDCYKLIQTVSTDPLIDAENLLKWQIFNCLAGNSDGHAKNIAFVYSDQQKIRLAPFYDLVCTRAVERIDSKLAFDVGGEFNPDKLASRHWENFAKQCDVRHKYLIEILCQMAETLLNQIEGTVEQFEDENGAYPALQRVKVVIHRQCKRALKLVK